ncbi:hypothetical protein FG93_00099 [Bosea sp. LC85]|uniref:DUF6644 family protein n=1 Tax=Bosea sp. LC85 TaxID=1502851 RepID=UPI0004E29803|nr:DUF6644 family protein [Bosea sp. LC85]KFC75959.1 hypothetical protein FG93_00099 [Bosea sp. LC85]
MEWIEVLSRWPGAVALQRSGTAYLLVNAAHILGVGLLVGAIIPLDLRLVGVLRASPLYILGPFLSRAAAFGLILALATGAWLFTVKPAEYVANPAFIWKMGLIVLALANVGLQHRGKAFDQALASNQPPTRVRLIAFSSLALWISALVAGRWIGFV